MKNVIRLVILISLLCTSVTMAQDISITQRGTYITPGAVVYYYSNQNIVASQNVVPATVMITTDSPIVEVISEDKTLGMAHVSIKLNNSSLPVLVWVRIVDLKYR